MPELKPDPHYPGMLSRASGPFQTICKAVAQELKTGDPARAYGLVEQLIATKPMGPVDRRCMLALRVALRAIVALRAAGQPPELDFRHFFGVTPGFPIRWDLVPALQAALSAELDSRAAPSLPCPNCGSAGTEIGWAQAVRGSDVPHARFYFDPASTVEAALPGQGLDPVHAHILVWKALANLQMRVPVRACGGCGLRYVSWQRESEVEDQYAAPPGGGFELDGEPVFGRGNVLSHVYDMRPRPCTSSAWSAT